MQPQPIKLNWFQRKALSWSGITKSSAATSAILSLSPGTAIWKTRDYENFAREGYIKNSDAYACINLIGRSIGGIRFFPYVLDNEGNKVEIKRGPLVDLLERPNPQMSGSLFFESIAKFLFTAGNSYVERVVGTSPAKPPMELWTPRPDRVEIAKGDEVNPIAGYRFIPPLNFASTTTWPADTISGRGVVQRLLHLKFFHPTDDWYGLSPLEVAARAIDQNNEAEAYNLSLLQNGMRPSGAVMVDGFLSEDQREEVNDQITQKSGSRKAGVTLLMEGGKFDYKPFSQNQVDSCFLEGQALSTRRICSAMGVPPQLVGDETSKTYANYQEARRSFYLEAVLPISDFICDEFSSWLCPFFGEEIKLGYDKNEIEAIQEDLKDVHERALRAYMGGAITMNTFLDETGRKPLGKEGDVLLVPSTAILTPIAQLAKVSAAHAQQEIAPPPPPPRPMLGAAPPKKLVAAAAKKPN